MKIHCSFTVVTTEPLAKVEVVLARSMYLLDIVKSIHFSYNAEHVYLDILFFMQISLIIRQFHW